MTTIVNKACEHFNCNNIICDTEKKGIRSYCCVEHVGLCLLCLRYAVYNIKGELPKYCSTHKNSDMTNVVSKRCEYEGCEKFAIYGESKSIPKYCSKHKSSIMKNVFNNCVFEFCTTTACFNYFGNYKGVYCSVHKLDNMINVVSPKCQSSWCETIGNPKYEGYCLACFVNNPENINKPAMRNYKTKEKEVVDKITQMFTNFTWVADKKVQDGCSRRRPDLLLDMGSHIIIVEVDENKHTDYDCSCENKRLMELSQDLQHRPIVFIRFNPDDYTNENGELIKSCWKLNKLGVMTITKTKQKEWEERISILRQQIQYWIDNPTEKTIEIIELFY